MSREEQFKGFGHAVIKRLLVLRDGWIDFNEDDEEAIDEYGSAVAQAAYDLVCHRTATFGNPGLSSRG